MAATIASPDTDTTALTVTPTIITVHTDDNHDAKRSGPISPPSVSTVPLPSYHSITNFHHDDHEHETKGEHKYGGADGESKTNGSDVAVTIRSPLAKRPAPLSPPSPTFIAIKSGDVTLTIRNLTQERPELPPATAGRVFISTTAPSSSSSSIPLPIGPRSPSLFEQRMYSPRRNGRRAVLSPAARGLSQATVTTGLPSVEPLFPVNRPTHDNGNGVNGAANGENKSSPTNGKGAILVAPEVEQLWKMARGGDSDGITSLRLTAEQVNERDPHGETPLYMAASNGHAAAVRALIKRGATVDEACPTNDANGYTCMYVAAQEGHVGVMDALMGDDDNAISLLPDLNRKCGAAQWSPIHAAAAAGFAPVVEWLLDNGCNRDIMTKAGETALYKASLRDHHDTVRVLMMHGATAESAHRDGWSALYASVQSGAMRAVHTLLECGAHVNYNGKDHDAMVALAALSAPVLPPTPTPPPAVVPAAAPTTTPEAAEAAAADGNAPGVDAPAVVAAPPPAVPPAPTMDMHPPLFIAIRVFNLSLIELLCAWGADCDRAPSKMVSDVNATVTATHPMMDGPLPSPRTLSTQLSLHHLMYRGAKRKDDEVDLYGELDYGVNGNGSDKQASSGGGSHHHHNDSNSWIARWRWPWQWCSRRVIDDHPSAIAYARAQGDEWYSDARTRQMLQAMRHGKHTYACKLTASYMLHTNHSWPSPVVRMFLSYVC